MQLTKLSGIHTSIYSNIQNTIIKIENLKISKVCQKIKQEEDQHITKASSKRDYNVLNEYFLPIAVGLIKLKK